MTFAPMIVVIATQRTSTKATTMADKKLAKKLANMSEADRAEFLEKQRLQDEENQRKKEEMLSRFLKEKLIKEEKTSKLNLVKIQNQWRAIMRKTKSKELSKDLEVMSQTFERVVDRKDAIISSLAMDLMEAEQQYQVALRSNLHNVDDLMDFQSKRIKKLKNEYQQKLDSLKGEFDTERHRMLAHHEQEMKELQDVLYAMKLTYSERETDAAHNFQSLMDELKNKSLEDTHSLRAHREAILHDLWSEFQKECKDYEKATKDRKLWFEGLKKRDEESSNTIARQMRKLHKLQETIVSLKHKMVLNAKESEEKTRAIRQDREALLTHFRALKQEMNLCRESERCSLTKLTLQSDAAIKQLERKREKGDRVLKLAEMCRKLETEEEKVLPFYSTSLSAEEEEKVSTQQAEAPAEPLAKVIQEYSSLQNFWKRYNKVLLDKLALDREHQVLENENSKLKMLLKQYLDGISVSDEILSQSNPLFVISHSEVSIPVADPRIQQFRAPITVVEAAHVVKNIIA